MDLPDLRRNKFLSSRDAVTGWVERWGEKHKVFFWASCNLANPRLQGQTLLVHLRQDRLLEPVRGLFCWVGWVQDSPEGTGPVVQQA